MAVRFSADGQDYTRTLTLGSITQFTICAWVKVSVDRNDESTFFELGGGGTAYIVQTTSDGVTPQLFQTGAYKSINGGALTVGNWVFFGLSVNGTNGLVVRREYNGSPFTTTTWTDGVAVTATTLRLGESVFTAEWLNGSIAAVKLWTGGALTQAELEQEAWTYMPQRTTNLTAWYPFTVTGTADYSGGGNTLSGGTGAVTEDGPPIAWRHGRRRAITLLGIDIEATPAPILAPWTIPAPGISVGLNLAPSPIVRPWSVPTPDISTTGSPPTQVTPSRLAAPWSIPAPDVRVDVTVAPEPIAGVWSVPVPDVTVPVNPGDAMTGDPGQIEWNGTLWGPSTPFVVQTIEGWRSLPSLDNLNVERPSRHGAWAARRLAQQRLVTIRLQPQAFSDPTLVDDLLSELDAVTGVLEDETEWPLVIKGYGDAQLVFGAIADRDIPMDALYSVGAPSVSLLIVCSDPRRYSLTRTGVDLAKDATVSLTNAGNTGTHPILRITGPVTDPAITNLTLDRVLEFDVVIASGDQMVIDTDAGTVVVGSESRLSTLTGASVPVTEFVLGRGVNDLEYTAASGGTAPVVVLYRDSWL